MKKDPKPVTKAATKPKPKPETQTDRVLKYIKTGNKKTGISKADLQDMFSEINTTRMSDILRNLVNEGKIQRIERGIYVPIK